MKFDFPRLNFLTKALHEPESAQSFFASSFKALKEIQVWPPSKEIVKQEMIVVCNTIVIYTAGKISDKHNKEPSVGLLQMKDVICHTLERTIQHMCNTSDLVSNTWKQRSIAEQLQRICDAIKDPIIHFRSLDVLSLLVTLCGLACLFQKVQGHKNFLTMKAFSIFQEIANLLCKDVLREPVPYKNGHLADYVPQVCSETSFPCVRDLVCLILCPCPDYVRDWSVDFFKWQWLDKFCYSKHLMKCGDYFLAMEQLETMLSSQLDPRIRSITLCMFAQCYMQQGCPQLALHTYKMALKVDKNNHMIFLYLSNVYKELQEADLELESLNLLVRFLTDKHLKSEELTPDLHWDALVFSVWEVVPTLSLAEAQHHFAKRCSELKRYTEASEQLMILLKLLEEDSEYTLIDNNRACKSLDVREVVVEAAEASALARQADQCLLLFDQFYPVLAVDDTASMSASLSVDMCDPSLSPAVVDNSQDILFSPCQPMASHQSVSFLEKDTEVSAETTAVDASCKGSNGGSTSALFENLCSLTRKKRIRSESISKDEVDRKRANRHGYEQGLTQQDVKDSWWSWMLVVRLLLCKADVLVQSQGYNDEVMDCLHRAQALLLKEETPIFVEHHDSNVNVSSTDAIKSPSHKRRRIMTNQQESAADVSPENTSQREEPAHQYRISQLWSNTMVKVVDRLLKASLSRGQKLSARNSAKLLLQLDPDNLSAQQALNQPLVLKENEDRMTRQNRLASDVS